MNAPNSSSSKPSRKALKQRRGAENRRTDSGRATTTESTGSTDRGEDAGSQGDAGSEGPKAQTPEPQVTTQQDRAANADKTRPARADQPRSQAAANPDAAGRASSAGTTLGICLVSRRRKTWRARAQANRNNRKMTGRRRCSTVNLHAAGRAARRSVCHPGSQTRRKQNSQPTRWRWKPTEFVMRAARPCCAHFGPGTIQGRTQKRAAGCLPIVVEQGRRKQDEVAQSLPLSAGLRDGTRS